MALKNIRTSTKQFSQSKERLANARQDADERMDDWENAITGLGGATDKRMYAQARLRIYTQDESEILWRGGDMAARVVETLPAEMCREGFDLNIQDPDEDDFDSENAEETEEDDDAEERTDAVDPEGAPVEAPEQDAEETAADEENGDASDQAEAMMDRLDELEVLDFVQKALEYERAYGGGAILLGCNDGASDWSKPLNEDNIQSFDWLNVLTPRELMPLEYYGDPRKPKYGQPSVYQLNREIVSNERSAVKMQLRIHESRIVRFNGTQVSKRQLLEGGGWGDSIFNRVASVVRDFDAAWAGASVLVSDFAQAVLKVKGLAEMVAQQGGQAIENRAKAFSMARSLTKTVLIDSEEEFERVVTPMSGLPEMLDRFCNRLAAATKTPVTLLMGQAPAGLNATGKADMQFFADQVRAEQKRKMRRQLTRIIKLLFLAKNGPTRGQVPEKWSIKFNPLSQLSPLEEAQMRYTVAQADALYITNQVADPAEIAKSRFGGDGYSVETKIDLKLREKMMANPHPEATLKDPTGEAADEKAKQESENNAKQLAAMAKNPQAVGLKPTKKE